jgi:hypothetical protein
LKGESLSNVADFIQAFLDYTSAYESPTDFFYWSAVAGLGAVMRDNCYLLLGDSRLYPNVFVLIVAKPAMRKAKPLNTIIELVKSVDNTKIVEGRTSIQAVIQRLGEVERRKDGRSISGASGIVYTEEISAMFTEDDANIPVLTDLYDWKSSYTSSLVSRGVTRLTNVVVSLLGASNEELLKPVFNNRAIYGGLLSRCLIVYGDRVRHRNSLMWEDPRKYDPTPLKAMLREAASLKGIFRIEEDAKEFYDNWYTTVCPTLEKSAGNTGAEGRIHTTALKLAMIISVSKGHKLVITQAVLEEAIERCQSLFANYRRLTLGTGKSKEAEPSIILLKLLWDAPGRKLTRREVIYKSWGDMSSETLDTVAKTLLEGGLIDFTEKTNEYKLTERSIAYFSQAT